MRNLLAKRIFQIVSDHAGTQPDRWTFTGRYTSLRGAGLYAYYGVEQVPVAPIRCGFSPPVKYILRVTRTLARRASEQKNLGEDIFSEIRPEGIDIPLG